MSPPLVVGVTGGIGAGKSSVARLLAGRGAEVIDVDALGRLVLEPEGGAYTEVIESFGSTILGADGRINRAELAAMVFGGGRLAELEAISHPAINAELMARVSASSRDIVVLDMAVLVESHLGHSADGPIYARVLVVEAPLAVRLERLVERGLTLEDARARIAAQATDEERRRLADVIVVNDGTRAELQRRVDDLWPTVEAWSAQKRE